VIAGFQVNRPSALWGGFCITAVRHDGATIDLMSTRAYSRVPSTRHLDELQRICWSLEEAAKLHGMQSGRRCRWRWWRRIVIHLIRPR
jgi:hypothetical protein